MGILQGVTEWLPISSSGQVMMAMMNLFGLDPDKAFSLAIYLHTGTLLAVTVKLRDDIVGVIFSLPNFKKDPLVLFLVVSTVFTAVIGIPVYMILKENFAGFHGDLVTALIGLFLILTGIVLRFSYKKDKTERKIKDINAKDMILLGIAQGFTILPGISRSGITVAALLFRNFNSETALKLSFLMSIPAIIGGVGLEVAGGGEGGSIPVISIIAGIAAAFISGYLAIDILLKFAKKVRFDMFCIFFGLMAVGAYLIFLVI